MVKEIARTRDLLTFAVVLSLHNDRFWENEELDYKRYRGRATQRSNDKHSFNGISIDDLATFGIDAKCLHLTKRILDCSKIENPDIINKLKSADMDIPYIRRFSDFENKTFTMKYRSRSFMQLAVHPRCL